MTERNVDELQKTASLHPNVATWLSPAEIESHCGSSTRSLGGVLLSNGCKLIHVPSYLKGLWNTCKHESDSSATWTIVDDDSMKGQEWEDKLRQFDTVVYSAGSGLFTDAILTEKSLPISLVRGQSLEMTLEGTIADKSQFSNEALLCGKYIAPLNDTNKVLIGATHEFQEEAINNDQVVEELRSRSYNLSTFVWDNAKIDKITTGFRVQSQRGAYGRMPIIGKISESEKVHPNSWIFTGLSARGLIYHGYFGNVLSSAILSSDESEILQSIPEALWWQCEKL
jgi:glycine/D-amino acid oxidase-like deaminating enzyme